jgi:hypothetical protein
MDRGRIVERGTFQELMRRGGRFAALVAAGDFMDETWDAEVPLPVAAPMQSGA